MSAVPWLVHSASLGRSRTRVWSLETFWNDLTHFTGARKGRPQLLGVYTLLPRTYFCAVSQTVAGPPKSEPPPPPPWPDFKPLSMPTACRLPPSHVIRHLCDIGHCGWSTTCPSPSRGRAWVLGGQVASMKVSSQGRLWLVQNHCCGDLSSLGSTRGSLGKEDTHGRKGQPSPQRFSNLSSQMTCELSWIRARNLIHVFFI